LRKLKTYLGRVICDIELRIVGKEDLREAFPAAAISRAARAGTRAPPLPAPRQKLPEISPIFKADTVAG
jgi:hypothetical protein